jgi:hypothetical protein
VVASAQWLVLIGPTLFVLTALVVGVRVLQQSRRTRSTPERTIGVVLLSAGVFGYTLIGGVPLVPGLSLTDLHLSVALGDLALNVGCVALYLNTWRSFRPNQVWAAGVFAAAIAVLAATSIASLWTASFTLPYHERPWWHVVGLTCQCLAFLWTSIESLGLWAQLRPRVRLGLVSPIVAGRILMWGSAAGWAFVLFTGYAVIWYRQQSLIPSFGAIAVLSVPGISAAAAVWLAFYPPDVWERWLVRRAALTRDRAE